jgi:hypothetical protein
VEAVLANVGATTLSEFASSVSTRLGSAVFSNKLISSLPTPVSSITIVSTVQNTRSPTSLPTSHPTSEPTYSPTVTPPKKKSNPSTGSAQLLIIIAVLAFAGLAVILFLARYLYLKNKTQDDQELLRVMAGDDKAQRKSQDGTWPGMKLKPVEAQKVRGNKLDEMDFPTGMNNKQTNASDAEQGVVVKPSPLTAQGQARFVEGKAPAESMGEEQFENMRGSITSESSFNGKNVPKKKNRAKGKNIETSRDLVDEV